MNLHKYEVCLLPPVAKEIFEKKKKKITLVPNVPVQQLNQLSYD